LTPDFVEPGRDSPILTVKPDPQLVSDTKTIIAAANAHIVQVCVNG